MHKKIEPIKKIINTEAYSEGILQRAQEVAISKEDDDDYNIEEGLIMVPNEDRKHKKSYSHGRK